jgi:hypothetical protein
MPRTAMRRPALRGRLFRISVCLQADTNRGAQIRMGRRRSATRKQQRPVRNTAVGPNEDHHRDCGRPKEKRISLPHPKAPPFEHSSNEVFVAPTLGDAAVERLVDIHAIKPW